MSKERPILFNEGMVRAILEGRKTQTRRVVKPQPDFVTDERWPARFTPQDADLGRLGKVISCRYGQPGDRLWVRETTKEDVPGSVSLAIYDADYAHVMDESGAHAEWWYSKPVCPSIHMPRWASRITLEITDIRVERLQDISGEDSAAEGVTGPIGSSRAYGVVTKQFARDQFMRLWESINGPDSWHLNPWVWVIEFERIDQKGV